MGRARPAFPARRAWPICQYRPWPNRPNNSILRGQTPSRLSTPEDPHDRTAELGCGNGHRQPPASLHQRPQARDRGTHGDHRGQGHLRLRRPGQGIHRGPGRALVCRARLQRGAPGPGRGRAAAQASMLPQLRAQEPAAHDRVGGQAARDRAGTHVQGVLRQLGLRGERHHDQDGLVLQQRARPARKEEDHQPHQGLSRGYRGDREPDRPALQPPRLRPADREHPAHLVPTPLPLRAAGRERGGLRDPLRQRARTVDPGRGTGDDRRLHRRAGHGRGRRDHAAPDLLGQNPGGAQEIRRAAGRR